MSENELERLIVLVLTIGITFLCVKGVSKITDKTTLGPFSLARIVTVCIVIGWIMRGLVR